VKRILIIEDESRVAKFIQKGLVSEGYEVDIALDGDEGLRMIEEGKYNVLIVDVMLPGRSGLSLVEAARKKDSTSGILVLSARDSLNDKLAGFNRGADDYLPKPFAFEELLARVQALSRRSALPREMTVLQYGDITMNLLTRQVMLGDTVIDFSKKEFDLLEYFLQNPERVLSRAKIGETVWQEQFERETNIVEVYMMYLRKKLERGEHRYFQTVRGVGYMLKSEVVENPS